MSELTWHRETGSCCFVVTSVFVMAVPMGVVPMGVVPMVRVIGIYGVDRVSGQLNQCYWRRDWGDELEADSVLVEEVITEFSVT